MTSVFDSGDNVSVKACVYGSSVEIWQFAPNDVWSPVAWLWVDVNIELDWMVRIQLARAIQIP